MKNKIQHIPYQFSNAVNPENDEHEMVLSGYIGSSSWWYDLLVLKV